MTIQPPIVITTDFGQSDSYVGVMKGVILSINPQATVIDLTHQIQPQNVQQAAFILGTSHNFFPRDSIHVVVIDPGVGTVRKAVLLVTPTAQFLAPDNGVLSHILVEYLDALPERTTLEFAGVVPVPAQCIAYQLTNPDYWLHPVSNTFHGRDVFAPIAAHLSLGVQPRTMGEALSEIVWRPPSRATEEGNRITGEVVYADHFGNLITNIPQSLLRGPAKVIVEVKGRRIESLSRTFHDNPEPASGEPLALLGSNGYLEIAVPDGSAQELLGAGTGETILLILDSNF